VNAAVATRKSHLESSRSRAPRENARYVGSASPLCASLFLTAYLRFAGEQSHW